MDADFRDRTRGIIGSEALERLKNSKVIIFGLGGVGGFIAEALARTGVGTIGLVDYDKISVTNINRQIIALESKIGQKKTKVLSERLKDINSDILTVVYDKKLTEETIDDFSLETWDYIIDAVDDVKAKLLLIKRTNEVEKPFISSMGAGNQTNLNAFKVSDISKTYNCPLAKKIRQESKKMGIIHFKTVFSEETPVKTEEAAGDVPSSIIFGPAAAGLLIASEVIKDLTV